ncbi:hypothetical protein GXM_04836 [Nostoc sphaeroides CCNUC1]|uniref:Uncharacterized protein n=1 Tax=Nostoc sphaeroides CCNUC1 TaxID=2653204 RepID=A0A5P8W4Z1_9NOSO|nr:hypothetical protein GXM_04836 [Nostoc sphaeroides CCNUC1]
MSVRVASRREAKPNVFVGFRASTQPTNRGIFRFGEVIAIREIVFCFTTQRAT